jgi:hypothetical protein
MGWGFTFTAGLARTKNGPSLGPSPFTPPVGSTTRRCGHWRRRPPNAQPMTLTPGTIARILTLTEVKRFLFNVLLFLGSLPEEYEPDQVLRGAREKKGHLRPIASSHKSVTLVSLCRGRPNSRVISRHFDLQQRQPSVHVKVEPPIRVHVLPYQRGQRGVVACCKSKWRLVTRVLGLPRIVIGKQP